MVLPDDILHRSERVYAYHVGSRHSPGSVRAAGAPLDWGNQPSPYRVFEGFPRVALPTNVLDAPTPTLALLRDGLDSLPESQLQPPQDVKTLASWLYLSYGLVRKQQVGAKMVWHRPTPSGGACYPCEVYVAAFAVEGLEPGFYHFSPRTFSLYKLREGVDTLYHIKRGRPDLEFLKTVPAALFVSTVFVRSSWRYRQRAYRYVLVDAGHLLQSLVTTATGLGMQTITRLRLNETMTRELIGLPAAVDYGSAEVVQGMVVWADPAERPMERPATPPPAGRGIFPIPRAPLAREVVEYGNILEAHRECLTTGLGRVELRPPATELSPVGLGETAVEFPADELEGGRPLRQVLLGGQMAEDFSRQTMSRSAFAWLNQLAFRGGTFFPIHPDGPHVGLVRPFWIVNDVTGVDPGVWYYHVKADRWTAMQLGDFRFESKYVSLEQEHCGNASALCLMTANLKLMLTHVSPDAYRLAHLEAGFVGQRLYLAGTALGLAYTMVGAFYDEEARALVGLEKSGWEVMAEGAIGAAVGSAAEEGGGGLKLKDDADWRG